jgi:7-cyano-7-deazaguanine tRNA-ribosyltransferase
VDLLSFEITHKDLLGRIGKIDTKSGKIETPHLLPVINPLIQPISSKDILTVFKCNAVITNAYLIRKNFRDEALARGIHRLLEYDGVVVTDSGAYQLLKYGTVDVQPEEIAGFQEAIATDIGVILDVPTGWSERRTMAEYSVAETVRRADLTLKIVTRSDILWEGPIQGGVFLDLVAKSAREMSKRPFDIYSLGSPTPIMERYMFDTLVDMIMAAKMNMPLSKPLHLFGAGHPLMLALAVALGCDLFDSASYAIFARQGRYLTENGTLRLGDIEYFPCSCPVCRQHDPSEIKELDRSNRERKLAEHNLYICFEEIRRIKQAIVEGRLWELLEIRARSHPSLLQALGAIRRYGQFVEKHSPSTKAKGLLYLGSCGLFRPEVLRHRARLLERYRHPRGRKVLLLLPLRKSPYRSAPQTEALRTIIRNKKIHVCLYGSPYGPVPIELNDVYPLSQTEFSSPMDQETEQYALNQVREYVTSSNYETIVVHAPNDPFSKRMILMLRKLPSEPKKKVRVSYRGDSPWSTDALKALFDATRIRQQERC